MPSLAALAVKIVLGTVLVMIAVRHYLAMEIYAIFRYDQSQALLVRVREWIDAHSDPVIILGGLALGFWLIGDSVYWIVAT